MKTVNGVTVPDDFYHTAQAIKQRGGKALVTLPDTTAQIELYDQQQTKSARCPNCQGGGYIILSIITGGPFSWMQPAQNDKSDLENGRVIAVAMVYDGKWWHMKNRPYRCPRCNGKKTKTINL